MNSQIEKTEKKIKKRLIKNGYNVISVKHSIDESCSPEIGFIVTIKGAVEDKKQIKKLESLMQYYAYGLEFQ